MKYNSLGETWAYCEDGPGSCSTRSVHGSEHGHHLALCQKTVSWTPTTDLLIWELQFSKIVKWDSLAYESVRGKLLEEGFCSFNQRNFSCMCFGYWTTKFSLKEVGNWKKSWTILAVQAAEVSSSWTFLFPPQVHVFIWHYWPSSSIQFSYGGWWLRRGGRWKVTENCRQLIVKFPEDEKRCLSPV